MNEREKLIELLENWGNKENDGVRAESIADYLLENGVIVPPVKVGDIVYKIVETYPKSYIKGTPVGVIVLKETNDFSKELWEDVYGGVIGSFADIGKTVFLTKEEAEKALEGGAE